MSIASLSLVDDNSRGVGGDSASCLLSLSEADVCVCVTVKYLFGVMTHEILTKIWHCSSASLVGFYGEQHIGEIVYLVLQK